MKNHNIYILLFSLCISTFVFGQKKEYRNSKVDSITFATNRQQLNSLHTEIYQKKLFTKNDLQIPYRFLTPKNENKNIKYPLVITLHNSTRIGHDNESQLEPFAKIWLREDIYTNYPCYVLSPQFSKRSSIYEKNKDQIQTSKPSDEAVALLELIQEIKKEYPNIDETQIYLIGYSMGGSTAQNLINLNPNQFAAMVSVAAVPDYSNLKGIKNKNIWLIHGEKDIDNPYRGSVQLFNKLHKNRNLIFTTFTHLDHHNIVIPYLLTDEIPKWLFKTRK